MAESLLIDHPAISRAVYHNWRPRPRVNSWEWVQANVRTPNGAPFDGDNVPWCRGVCQAYDDPRTREIDLMWGSRGAKTLISQALTLCGMATNPMPGLFVSSCEKVAVRNVRDKLYPMLERCRPLAGQLKPKQRRSVYQIDLWFSKLMVGWSGSDSTLADLSAWWLHYGEVDKSSANESSEADPVELAAERVKEYPDHKMIFESTPAKEDGSRMKRKLALSNNCRYYVPCPRCHHHQVLRLGVDLMTGLCQEPHEKRYGIIWDGMDKADCDPDVAGATARYVCEKCRGEIHDEQRAPMMRRGEWVPEGQWIDKKGKLHGTPRRSVEVWGSQLSSYYSLQLRWGDIAKKFVKSFGRPRALQNFVNSWAGLPYSPHRSKTEPEELGERLRTDWPLGMVPPSALFLTCGIDCQDGFFVFEVHAWSTQECGHLVDYGVLDSWSEVLQLVERKYAVGSKQQAEGDKEEKKDNSNTETMPIALSLIDSGAFTKDVYRFCKKHSRRGRLILPAKGASTDLGGEPYVKKIIGAGKSASRRLRRAALVARGLLRIHINVDYWESELQHALDLRKPGQFGSLSLCSEAAGDLNLCEQLLNGTPAERTSLRAGAAPIWIKRWEQAPNDHRDCYRMSRVAAELFVRGQWAGLRTRKRNSSPAAAKPGAAADVSITPTPEASKQAAARAPFVRRTPGRRFVRRRRS